MRTLVRLLTIFAAILATAPAAAELYKWVDERGVTNYSNAPPANPALAKKLTRVESKLSVYTPDERLLQAVKALQDRRLQALSEPAAGRQARQYTDPTPSPTPYEQCLAAGRLDCDVIYGGYYPYLPGVLIIPTHRVQPTRFLTSPPFGMSGATMAFRPVPGARASRGLPMR